MIMECVASDHRGGGAVAVRVAYGEVPAVAAHGRRVEREDADDSSNWLKKTMRLGAGCSKGKHDARADRDAHSPSLHPRMKRGGVCAHLSALNEISSAIEHREIKVFVGPVDANKECIRDVHGVSVFSDVLVLSFRKQQMAKLRCGNPTLFFLRWRGRPFARVFHAPPGLSVPHF
jgi:hypothetical protein